MEIGIVGLPNVGKSTLFNALTEAGAGAENYPFCTVDPNVGVVNVPDWRLDILVDMYKPDKKTPVTIKFVDIAGLVKGASKGEGLGNQFLGHIRNVDAIAHVVRCFTDSNISHVEGDIDPVRDIDIIDTELIMADLESLENKREQTERMTKSGDRKYGECLQLLNKMITQLERGKRIRNINTNEKVETIIKELQLLTAKPVIYVANISEEDINKNNNNNLGKVSSFAAKEGAEVVEISASIEADIAELEKEEAELFLEEMGLGNSGLGRVIKASYNLLNLITFFTVAGGNEVRATTVKRGSTAYEAAGKIHSDMQRGFIKAEVIAFDDLHKAGSIAKAREQGLVRLEGRDYEVQDGDICYFKFNV